MGDADPPVPYNHGVALKGKIMNDGVKILLERMQTHPEEFNGEVNKWGSLLLNYKCYLDPEDANALNEGINKLLQQKFTEKILEELVDPKKSGLEDVINQYRAKGIASVGQTLASSTALSNTVWNGGVTATANSNSLTLGSTTIDESHLEHIKAHLEAIHKPKNLKEHKTLFGRLFNYQ